jgi:hypothetical protein
VDEAYADRRAVRGAAPGATTAALASETAASDDEDIEATIAKTRT